MTLEEKRDLLGEHCCDTSCKNCKLDDPHIPWKERCINRDCLNIASSPESDIDKALEIIGKADVIEIDEKRAAIRAYCDEKHPTGCTVGDRCPLFDLTGDCWSADDSNIINRNYEILFGKDSDSSETENPESFDIVNKAEHYNQGGIECIEAIKASMSPEEYAGFLKGQVIKYTWRYRHKGKPVEDLEKAQYYHNKLIELMKESEAKSND